MIREIRSEYEGIEISFNELLKLKIKMDKLFDNVLFGIFKDKKNELEFLINKIYGYISEEYKIFEEIVELIELENDFVTILNDLRFPNYIDNFEDVYFGVNKEIINEIKKLNINKITTNLNKIIKKIRDKKDIIFDLMNIRENEIKYIGDNVYIGMKYSYNNEEEFFNSKGEYYVIKLNKIKNDKKVKYTKYKFNIISLEIESITIIENIKDFKKHVNINSLPKEVIEKIIGLEICI